MGERWRYFIRRTIQSVFILWAISIIAFIIIHLTPGGPIAIFEDPSISPETIQHITESLGLSEPIPIQYVRWLGNLLRGDLGQSFIDSRPVIDKIVERLPATIQLNLAARMLGLLGIPLGIYAALYRGTLTDNLIRIFTVIGSASPHWWLGLLLLIFVAAPTGWFPLGGMYTIGKQNNLLDQLWHLVLPATISALGDWIMWSRYMRSQVLDILYQDYIRTAHAKGIKRPVVLIRHVLPNALIPAVTILGDSFAGIISGSVTLETIFSWPGIGRLAFMAAIQRDYPVVIALLIVAAILVSLGNLLADLLYTVVDPRIELL